LYTRYGNSLTQPALFSENAKLAIVALEPIAHMAGDANMSMNLAGDGMPIKWVF